MSVNDVKLILISKTDRKMKIINC